MKMQFFKNVYFVSQQDIWLLIFLHLQRCSIRKPYSEVSNLFVYPIVFVGAKYARGNFYFCTGCYTSYFILKY